MALVGIPPPCIKQANILIHFPESQVIPASGSTRDSDERAIDAFEMAPSAEAQQQDAEAQILK